MKNAFTIIPQFLKDPRGFHESVQRNENLGEKARSLFISIVVFLFMYGFITGLSHGWMQALSTAVKIPLLFLLTLAFTLPALYFFALALLNVQFSVAQAGVVVLSGIGTTAFLLLGLSPVTLFFVLTSSNYAFFQLIAVLFVAVSGVTGLYYVLRGFTWVDKNHELTGGSLGSVLLRVWVVLFGFVGAQMTWRLSPLIGDPARPFILMQPSRDNFFVDVFKAIQAASGLRSGDAPALDLIGLFICSGIVGILALMVGLWLGSKPPAASARQPAPLSQPADRNALPPAPPSDQP
ncbi:MAG: hypothetical protein ACOY0R_04745 [Chloroflexota bacterium]